MLAHADWLPRCQKLTRTKHACSKVSAFDAIIKLEKSAEVANSDSLPPNVLLKLLCTLNPLRVAKI